MNDKSFMRRIAIEEAFVTLEIAAEWGRALLKNNAEPGFKMMGASKLGTSPRADLQRVSSDPGIKGFIIHSHTGGEYLDEAKFLAIFEAAESLKMPLYLWSSHGFGPYVGGL